MPRPKEPSYPTCPNCGSHEFLVDGVVGYRQPYDAKADEWSSSKIFWEVDYPEEAKCGKCERDASRLLRKAGVVDDYFEAVPKAGQQNTGRRMYLVNFAFRSGEYEQPFHGVFVARNKKTLERKIHNYLKTYYPGKADRDGNTYFYFGGEVAVEYEGWEEVTDPMRVVRRLRV